MKNILLTGGAGFIGSHLVEALLKDAANKVVCIDNFDDFYAASIKKKNMEVFISHPNFHFIENDICNLELYKQLAGEKFDAIIHLAAKAGVRPSIADPVAYEQVNIQGTMRLLEFAKDTNIPQFVFASSSSVYGVNPNTPWSESDYVLNPISPYAATKVSGELIGHTYSHLYNIRFIGLRFFTVYGPRQRPDLAIHKFFKLMSEGKSIPFFGDGSTCRDYTYVDDIVKGIVAALHYDKSMFEIINLGNHQTITLAKLVEAIEKTIGKESVLEKHPPQAGDVPITFSDVSKAAKLLGYHPSTKIEDGLTKFHEWFKANNS